MRKEIRLSRIRQRNQGEISLRLEVPNSAQFVCDKYSDMVPIVGKKRQRNPSVSLVIRESCGKFKRFQIFNLKVLDSVSLTFCNASKNENKEEQIGFVPSKSLSNNDIVGMGPIFPLVPFLFFSFITFQPSTLRSLLLSL